jgi:thiopurine S-methyltransferase
MDNRNDWQARWEQGRTGWDLSGAHPLLDRLLASWRKRVTIQSTERVWVPGCGRAHDAFHFATLGFRVVASDLIGKAVDCANALYTHPNLDIVQEDALMPTDRGIFDAVYDRAMLCALEPEHRSQYVDACYRQLKPGGYFLSIPFTTVVFADQTRKGPPYAIGHESFAPLFKSGWTLIYWQDIEVSSLEGVIQSEALVIWRRDHR